MRSRAVVDVKECEKNWLMMNFTGVQVGSRVYVIASGPFKGLRGTVQSVDAIPSLDESCYFYLVKLERSYFRTRCGFNMKKLRSLLEKQSPHLMELAQYKRMNDTPRNQLG